MPPPRSRPRAADGSHISLSVSPPRPRLRPAAPSAPLPASQPGAKADGPVQSERPSRSLPRLTLAPLAPAELLYERLHEPSDESPILYRERAYLVDALQTDDELEEHLGAELSRIRRDWRHRDAAQFVHLSIFDHRFRGEPMFPPVATLSWKDWQGRSEIWVRGVWRSTMPPGMPLDSRPPLAQPDLLAAAERRSIAAARDVPLRELEASERDTLALLDEAELSERSSDALALDPVAPGSSQMSDHGGDDPPASSEQISIDPEALLEDTEDDLGEQRADDGRPPDSRPAESGPGWQSPHRSGEFRIPKPEELVPEPSSQRVIASDELIGALFERMQELAYAPTIGAAADYVLGALAEHIPCDGALIHVLDVEAEELVVMRALGPDSIEVLTRRTPALRSHLGECLRRRTTLELGQGDIARCRTYWQVLGVVPRHVIACPIVRRKGPLGVIELGRVTSRGPFSAGQVRALEYVCEQFADFVADRPIDLARSALLPIPPA